MKDNHVHVLYIITKLELGGAQKVCLNLAHGININGHSSSLISGTEGVFVSEAKKLKSTFLLDNFKREVGFNGLWNEFKLFTQIIAIIKKLKKEYPNLVVHTHSTKAGIIGRWAAFFAGVKTIIHTVHGFGFNDYQSKLKKSAILFVEYLTCLITTHFVCVSQKDRELGIKKFPKFGLKSSIIRAAAEWEKFYTPAKLVPQAFGSGFDKFVIGTVSCFKPQKNLFDLLNAFKIVYQQIDLEMRDQVQLQIIGDGVMRGMIEHWINMNNLTGSVVLLGWQDNTAKFMRKWNVFSMSSLWEGLPIAIIEARLCRLPVVAYDVGGIFEVIFNDKNGFLVPPKNIDLLAKKLKLLVENPSLAVQMGQFNDELSEFSDTVMLQKHIDLYCKLTGFN
ncbi:MAG: hypothetical protein US49_C0006G0171 [candidate division TM6 bacterium GW2011_GWF2_37_49]|nr:MAG: hypothetical protein US49_C0006G0171 [candidate division TM6 bacterium GW2011_GWF2_37_49]